MKSKVCYVMAIGAALALSSCGKKQIGRASCRERV